MAFNKVSRMISVSITLTLTLISLFKRHHDLTLENFSLRQQLGVFKRCYPRPKLRSTDRLFWVWGSKVWTDWRDTLITVKPETVITWHRQGFRLYWRWLSRRKSVGRPMVGSEVRGLIKVMAQANPLWGAPRIHGELLKLGIEV
jgi:putative transposase